MNGRIKKEKFCNEELIIISAIPHTARKLEEELKQMEDEVSVMAGRDVQIPSLTGDAILREAHEEGADVLILQQENSVSTIIEEKVSQSKLTRDRLHGDYNEIVGTSSQIFEVLQQIENLAATPLRVLISGETGTGKGVVARALHKNSGRSGEMVSINCAAIPKNLVESELFGHEKGAFTSANARHIGKFERAHKGTLFLDEITEMPLSIQPKLLRAIEEGEIEHIGGKKSITVDVRIIAATNRDIAQAVKNGTFRKDLYYRLNVGSILLPSLSERRGDIEILAIHFLEKHCRFGKVRIPQVPPSTLNLLKGYPWPGNVRELENVIERASYLAKGETLLPEHLPKELQMYQDLPANIPEKLSTPGNEQMLSVPLGTTFKAMEKTFICTTLAWLEGNRTKTANVLGIGIRTLQRKLKKYGI